MTFQRRIDRRAAPLALAIALAVGSGGSVFARLPPLSDEAKAKAAEAAAKAAHGNKVADYQSCLAMERVAARYQAEVREAGQEPKAPTTTAPCTDPGPFVPAAPAAASPAPAAASAPAGPKS